MNEHFQQLRPKHEEGDMITEEEEELFDLLDEMDKCIKDIQSLRERILSIHLKEIIEKAVKQIQKKTCVIRDHAIMVFSRELYQKRLDARRNNA